MRLLIKIILLLTLIPTVSNGTEAVKDKGDGIKIAVEVLSPDLRVLLSKEMTALQSAMMSIVPQYIAGNWAEIESTARQMKDSYILKQSLTEEQVKELQSKLPHAFIKEDQWFHYLAGMLEHAAKSEKPELVNFYFSKMNESCISCHSAFATHKFPALKSNKTGEHTH
jgi:hypothetical protein